MATAKSVHTSHLKRTHLTFQLTDQVNKEVVLMGWVHDVRVLGGIAFLLLRDQSGIVQVTAPKSKAPADVLKEIGTLHQEDVVAVRGKVVQSKIAKKGIEVIPEELEVLTRSETPLPLDPRGVQNTLLDTRLNWRFLRLRIGESRGLFRLQCRRHQFFMGVFIARGFIGTATPRRIQGAIRGQAGQ